MVAHVTWWDYKWIAFTMGKRILPVICMKHKGKTHAFLISKHSVVLGDLWVRAKVDKNENKESSLSNQKS